jgi:hypothetical protein
VTVIVTLPDGGNDEYSRFGDTYFRHGNGTLDVIRVGVSAPYSYEAGSWTQVEGDQRKHQKRSFWR